MACWSSCAQVEISVSSSSVPMPPGSATNPVGMLEHRHLALMHALGDDQLVDAGEHAFLGAQEFRDDAGHVAARFKHGFGHFAHEAQAAAAINQANAGLDHGLPKVLGPPPCKRGSCRGRSRSKHRDFGSGFVKSSRLILMAAAILCRFATLVLIMWTIPII